VHPLDSGHIPLEKVKAIAQLSGAELTGRFRHLLLDVKGIRHQRHARQVGETLQRLSGITDPLGNLMPEDKCKPLKSCGRRKAKWPWPATA
jgi:hypothetical protein